MPRLMDFYLTKMEPHPFELRMHLLVQGPEADPKGVRKVNEGIELCKDGWVFTFADDTEQNPGLFRVLGDIIAQNPTVGIVVFGQRRVDCVFPVSPEQSKVGFICGGSLAFCRSFLGDERFDLDEPLHRTDGRLIARLFAKDQSRFFHCQDVLTMENSLEWLP